MLDARPVVLETNAYYESGLVKIADAIYVLHCFQKKSKSGIATPKKDIDLIKQRLRDAQEYAKGVKS